MRDWCQKQEDKDREKIQREIRVRCQQVARMCKPRAGRRNPEPRKTIQQRVNQIITEEARARLGQKDTQNWMRRKWEAQWTEAKRRKKVG